MRRSGTLPLLWRTLRSYAVTVAALGCIASAFVEVHTTGIGPVPQHPPDNLEIAQNRVLLQWNRGSSAEVPIELEVSMDDPSFASPILKRAAKGKTYTMTDIEPGHTYYWRLVQKGMPSPVGRFRTSPLAVEF